MEFNHGNKHDTNYALGVLLSRILFKICQNSLVRTSLFPHLAVKSKLHGFCYVLITSSHPDSFAASHLVGFTSPLPSNEKDRRVSKVLAGESYFMLPPLACFWGDTSEGEMLGEIQPSRNTTMWRYSCPPMSSFLRPVTWTFLLFNLSFIVSHTLVTA